MGEPFIKLYKKLLKWEWYEDTNTFRLFMHCLLKANWKAGEWHGMTINPGQFVTSLPKLSKETGLSIQQTRTALTHMISTGEITDKSYSKFRVITVNKWSDYQEVNRQLTDNQQTTNTQSNSELTSIEEIKNKRIKEIKNNSTFVKPTVEEVRAYCLERGNGVDPEAFVSFYDSKGWMIGKNKMKDWKAAVRTWERSRKTDKPDKPKFDGFTQRTYDYSELEKSIKNQ